MSTNNSIDTSGFPLSVAKGLTGKNAALTSNAIVCGGTTSTGALQSVSPNTAGFYYASQGAGSLGHFAAAPAGDFVKLQSASPSSAASSTFTLFNSNYSIYQFVLSNLIPANNNDALYMQLSYDGTNYISTSTYAYGSAAVESSTSIVASNNTGDTQIILSGAGVSNADNTGCSGEIKISNLYSSNYQFINTRLSSLTGSTYWSSFSGGVLTSALGSILGVKIFFSTGNIASGTINLYGITA